MSLKKLTSGKRLLAAASAALVAGSAFGQCLDHEDQKLLPGDGGGVDYFGCSSASWGDEVLIGAENKDLWVGGAYLWESVAGTWVEVAALEASDGVRNDLYGASVALNDDWIMVGATQFFGTATETGKVYVYDRGGSLDTADQVLLPSLGQDYDRFGHAIALVDDVLVVSAIGDDTGADAAGAVYVFEFDGTDWIETQILSSPNPSANARFGEGLAFEGTTLLVGCPGDGTNVSGAGAVYVYEHGTTGFTLDHSVFGTELNAQVGAPLAMSGDHALSGLLTDGVVALERAGGIWQITQTLLASDNVGGDDFGHSVAIEGTRAAVGAPFADIDGLNNVGAMYAYQHDGVQWLEVGKFTQSVAQFGSYVGSSVAIHGDQVLAGAEREDAPDTDSGAVYAFTVPDIGFDVQPNLVGLGDPVSFLSCGGSAGAPLLVFVTAINGAPLSRKLFRGSYDTNGAFRLDTHIPNDPALVGNDLTLITFALMTNGDILASNDELLSIQ